MVFPAPKYPDYNISIQNISSRPSFRKLTSDNGYRDLDRPLLPSLIPCLDELRRGIIIVSVHGELVEFGLKWRCLLFFACAEMVCSQEVILLLCNIFIMREILVEATMRPMMSSAIQESKKCLGFRKPVYKPVGPCQAGAQVHYLHYLGTTPTCTEFYVLLSTRYEVLERYLCSLQLTR